MVFGLLACNDAFRPDDVITEQEMADIMLELQLAEAKVKDLRIPRDSAREIYALYELKIFSERQLDTLTYRNSLKYYLENSRAMSRINQMVLDSLTARQARLDLELTEPADEAKVKRPSAATSRPDSQLRSVPPNLKKKNFTPRPVPADSATSSQ